MSEELPGPVTVAVTNYNGAAWIDECLLAVRALRGRVVDIIVVDNASTDDSVERIQRHPVRLFRMHRNDGPCPARNRALIEATTPWVLQLDSDILVGPGTLELLWAEARPGVAAVQPRAVLANDPQRVHYDGGSLHYVGVMCLDNFLERVPEGEEAPRDVDAVISMALLLHRVSVLDAGGYDEAFFILFEDHDLSYRLRARGQRLRHVPAAVVRHHEGTAGISFRPGAAAYPARRAFLHARNRGYLVLKCYGWPALILSWPGRALYALVWLVFAARGGVLGSYLRGRWELLGLLPSALRWRKRLAGHRAVGDGRLLGAPPLTFSPHLARRGGDAGLQRLLDGALRGWWTLVRWMVPR